jgi:hypothetical protein
MSRTNRIARISAFAVAAALLAACGGGDGPSAPPPGGGSNLATLTVINQSPNNTASFVRTRSCGTTGWGPDLLGSGILGKGESVSTTLPAGCYDVRVTPSESGADYLYFNQVGLSAGETEVLTITSFPPEP